MKIILLIHMMLFCCLFSFGQNQGILSNNEISKSDSLKTIIFRPDPISTPPPNTLFFIPPGSLGADKPMFTNPPEPEFPFPTPEPPKPTPDTTDIAIELNSLKFSLGNNYHADIETNIQSANQKFGFTFSHNSDQIGFTKNWYSKRYSNKLIGYANFEPFNKLSFGHKISFQDQGTYLYGNENPMADIRNKANKLEYRSYTYEGKLSNELASKRVIWEGLFTANKLIGIQNLDETLINGQVNLKASISNTIKVGLISSISNAHFKFESIDLQRTLFSAQPSISYKTQKYHLEAGITYTQDQASSKEYIFPKFEFGYKFNNNHQFVAGLTGDVQFNTFQSLLRENLFIAGNQGRFINTSSPTQIFTLFKGGKYEDETEFTYFVKLKYAQLNHLPIFIPGIRSSEREPLTFNTEYIGENGNVNHFQIDVNFDKKFNSNWSTALKLKTNTYSGDLVYDQIILKPSVELNYQVTFQRLNWEFTPNVTLVSGLYGYQTKINQVVKLDDIRLLNVNVAYRLDRTLRLFANLNNLFNQKYQRIINYREIGFNFNAGILYAF